LALEKFTFSSTTRQSLSKNFKITHLYPIQADVFKPVVEGKDLIGRSKTGTGKTLAFVLPLVERLLKTGMDSSAVAVAINSLPPIPFADRLVSVWSRVCAGTRPVPRQTQVLILEPTRELARQVTTEIEKLDNRFSTAAIYGGAAAGPQIAAVAPGLHFLVATPGRLTDLLNRGVVDLSALQSVVLDEADEMLRMGFQEQVEDILARIKTSRQTLLFSATVPKWVRDIAGSYLKDPIVIDAVGDERQTTPDTITHYALPVPDDAHLTTRAEIIASAIERLKIRPDGRYDERNGPAHLSDGSS
jgi:superfamily II DNA/RNA helicase